MKQRWTNDNKPSGFVNISINDITYDASDSVKHNILKACNECSYNGFLKNNEFALLLSANTGEPYDSCCLLEGTQDEVDISEWVTLIETGQPLSLIIVHNHTIDVIFSFDDLYTFLSHTSLKASIVTVGEAAYILEKTETSICDWEIIEQSFTSHFPGADCFKTDSEWDINKFADYWTKVLSEFNIDLRRWS